jgi:YegS/Rv2252/BmrU family lipid kinase
MENLNNGKWGFIVNPTAGNHFGEKYLQEINSIIQKRKIVAEILETKHKGHATELAETFYNQGFRNIVAVGGDGTINEVAQFLMHKEDAVLGVISAGTGNDMVQILGFPNRFEDKDWDAFLEKNVIAMDLGLCNGHIFLNGMGLGFDAEVAAQNYLPDGEIKRGGSDKYLWHILKTLLLFKEKVFKLQVNNKFEQKTSFMTTISIGRRFAAKYFITPTAIANDGLFDVCRVKKLNLLQRVKIFTQVPTGSHIHNKNVDYFQTNKLSIEFENRVPYHLDGELYYDTKMEVEVLPKKIQVIYNANGNHFFA